MSFSKYQNKIHFQKSNKWRELYLKILDGYKINKVLEVGAGTPDFLKNLNAKNKVALDGGGKFRNEFVKNNIDFYEVDLDHGNLPILKDLDLIVASDVLEHLIYPQRTLNFAHNSLTTNGIFISHVPNEFYFTSLIKILLGLKSSNIFHTEIEEYKNPHIRRFTKIGYLDFLKTKFNYNLYISDLYYNLLSKVLSSLKINPPYMIEPGPTYISTNDKNTYDFFLDKKKNINLY
jgi:SAM-dependent methyltransferase